MAAVAQISGLGRAGLTRAATASCETLAVQAIDAAIADAGLGRDSIDGLLISRSGLSSEPGLRVHARSGLPALRLLQFVDCEGTSAIQQLQTALLAIEAGVARHVVCVFADTPLQGGVSGREAFTKAKTVAGLGSLRYTAGAFGGTANYALSAQRWLHEHGADEQALGAVAVSTRAWAMRNPEAVMRKPMTLDDYLGARYIVEPLRLFDCALPVNGAFAFIVSHRDHAGEARHPPVHVRAIAQAHAGPSNAFSAWRRPAAHHVAQRLFAEAGVRPAEVDVRAFYDAFTIMTLLALEDYGFCAPGGGAGLAQSGALAPGGALPTNTGGGHLSGHYMQGMTPLVEAIEQARGSAGERQCARHDLVLATNEGGWFDSHAGVLLSPHARTN